MCSKIRRKGKNKGWNESCFFFLLLCSRSGLLSIFAMERVSPRCFSVNEIVDEAFCCLVLADGLMEGSASRASTNAER